MAADVSLFIMSVFARSNTIQVNHSNTRTEQKKGHHLVYKWDFVVLFSGLWNESATQS